MTTRTAFAFAAAIATSAVLAPTEREELMRGLLEIPDAAGVRVSCSEGCLWITLDNDPRDIVLEPAELCV